MTPGQEAMILTNRMSLIETRDPCRSRQPSPAGSPAIFGLLDLPRASMGAIGSALMSATRGR